MRHDDATREQMQFVLHAAGQFPILAREVFRVADDRMIDVRHVGAQLMRAAGDRLEREPRQQWPGGFHHRVIGHGVAGALLAVARDAHERLVFALLLDEVGRDAALLHLGNAGDQRPIDLARRARAESLCQSGRRKARLGDQQAAGGILVEPVHQPRPLAVGIAQDLQHAVEMARGAGAALHRKPIGLLSTSTSASS